MNLRMETDLSAAQATVMAYDRIAGAYDAQVQGGQWMRNVLWKSYERLFQPGQHVLDLSCGTGIDALHLAQSGIDVVGIDISAGMIEQLEVKARRMGLSDRVHTCVHDVNDLQTLPFDKLILRQALRHSSGEPQDGQGGRAVLRQAQDDHHDHGERAPRTFVEPPFDGIISAFAGLSSLPDLSHLACEAADLLKPGGFFLVHMLSRGNVWARLEQARHGQLRLTLRAASRGGAQATLTVAIGGVPVRHYLYYPHEAYRHYFEKRFVLRRAYSLGCVRPPNAPRWCSEPLLGMLGTLEKRVSGRSPFINWGPFFVLEMQKRM